MEFQKNSNLSKIQQELEEHTSNYVEDDFKLKLKHDKAIRPLLEKRDEIINNFSREEKKAFYETIIQNFEALADFFPVDADGNCDVSFLKSIKVQYFEPFKMSVILELYENEYIENLTLEKVIHLYNEDPETTKITWKNERGSCLLFDFISNSDDDFETFDILYEFYVDMLFFSDLDME